MTLLKQIFLVTGTLLLSVSLSSPHSWAQSTAMVMKEFKAWTLHQSRSATHNICYVTTKPISKKPSKANRAAIVFYVSAWPKEGIRSEVSVKFGYPLDAKKPITITIGNNIFKLSARDERAYFYDATKELKMIDAMKQGSNMIVKANSKRGTATTDTYSLNGITSALKSLADSCN